MNEKEWKGQFLGTWHHPCSNPDYCSSTGKNHHSYYDMSYWNGQNYPSCSLCGYVDKTRTLEEVDR